MKIRFSMIWSFGLSFQPNIVYDFHKNIIRSVYFSDLRLRACSIHKSKLSNNILHVLRHSKYFHDSEKFNILNYISAQKRQPNSQGFRQAHYIDSISLNYACNWEIEFGSDVDPWIHTNNKIYVILSAKKYAKT